MSRALIAAVVLFVLSAGAHADEPRWVFECRHAVRSTPAVWEDLVFFADGPGGGSVYAVDRATGRPLWEHPPASPLRAEVNAGQPRASVLVAGGRVYVAASSYHNRFAVLDAKTGDEVWGITIEDGINSTPALCGDELFFGSNGTEGPSLWCLNVRRREVAWAKRVVPGRILGTPLVAGGRAFAGTGWHGDRGMNGLVCVDRATGGLVWGRYFQGGIPSSPAEHRGRIIFGCQDGNVYALSAEDGAELWRFAAEGPVGAPALTDSGDVLIGSDDGSLYCLSATGGKLRWRFATGAPIRAKAVVTHDETVCVASMDGNVHLLDRERGIRKAVMVCGAGIVAAPLVTEDAIVVGTEAGRVYCFSRGETSGVRAANGSEKAEGRPAPQVAREADDASRRAPSGAVATRARTWSHADTKSVVSEERLTGPIFDAHLHAVRAKRAFYVIGTAGKDAEGNRAVADYVNKIAAWACLREDGLAIERTVVVEDRKATREILARGDLYLYGTPSANTVIAAMKTRLPIRVGSDGVTVGNTVFRGGDIGVILVTENPYNSAYYATLYTGTSQRIVQGANDVLHGPTDYVVYSASTRLSAAAGKDGRECYLARGFFRKDGRSWSVDPEDMERSDFDFEALVRDRIIPSPLEKRVFVYQVLGGSQAVDAGLRAGDRILRYNEAAVGSALDLYGSFVRDSSRRVEIVIERGAERQTITVRGGKIGIVVREVPIGGE
jgi:outer membrane protein assembly factor BamB